MQCTMAMGRTFGLSMSASGRQVHEARITVTGGSGVAAKQMFILGIVGFLALGTAACSVPGGTRNTSRVRYSYDILSTGCCTLIAHAGGAIDGNPYTDSREALLLSIRNGYHLIELDFDRTSDGDWFVQHAWKGWASHTGYHGKLPPTTAVVDSLKDHYVVLRGEYSIAGVYTVMSLDDLLGILAGNPKVKVITDAKSDKATLDLAGVLKATPAFEQFVFQVYSLKGLQAAADVIPQKQLILTTYMMRDWYATDGFNEELLSKLAKYPHLFALTIPMYTAHDAAKMSRIRDALPIPILAHGKPSFINSRNLHWQLGEWGVNGVYVE